MIVCVGDLLIDVLVRRHAGEGVDHIALRPGGSAANVAAWLAYLGVPCGFVGAAGRDLAGDLLVEDLRRRGIALAVSRHADAPSGVLLLETLPGGATRPSARRGANDLLALDADQWRLIDGAAWLHLSMYAFYAEVSRAPLLRAIAAAHARGARVSIDLGAPHLLRHIGADAYRELLRRAAPDVLLANEGEAALLAGLPYDPHDPHEGSIERRAADEAGLATGARLSEHARMLDEERAALARFAPLAVVKRGAAGCDVLAPDSRASIAAPPTLEEVDGTGAGDAFAAGFIAALHTGQPPRGAAARAAALGARCAGVVGGRPPAEGDSRPITAAR